MKEKDIKKIEEKKSSLCFLLGCSMSLISQLQAMIDENGGCYDEKLLDKIEWFKTAIENVVYKDIPVPRMP